MHLLELFDSHIWIMREYGLGGIWIRGEVTVSVFSNLPFLKKAGIHFLLTCTYQQLFQHETSDDFTDNVDGYMGGKGLFSNQEIPVARYINVADCKVSAQYWSYQSQ